MKIVMILDDTLSPGPAANTAAVLGISLREYRTGLTGPECSDGDGNRYGSITKYPIPVLKARPEVLKDLYRTALGSPDLEVIGFTHTARTSRSYEDYAKKLSAVKFERVGFAGLCLFGDPGAVASLSGGLELYA